MIKIISGKYRGRKLFEVPNLYVRPTQAVVRKSMMQILEPFENLEILDLYAGVGTLGIEAISRGASSLTAVEKNKLVLQTLTKNLIARVGCNSRSFWAIKNLSISVKLRT